jgi:hypothetical protein
MLGRGVIMDTLLGSKDSLKSEDAVTRRIVIDAKRAFDGVADEAFLENVAHEAVRELWRDSIKVTTFVPLLAMRRIRDIVDAQDNTMAGPGM